MVCCRREGEMNQPPPGGGPPGKWPRCSTMMYVACCPRTVKYVVLLCILQQVVLYIHATTLLLYLVHTYNNAARLGIACRDAFIRYGKYTARSEECTHTAHSARRMILLVLQIAHP